jgi:hypothetical protein
MHRDMINSKPGTAIHSVFYNTMDGNPAAFITSLEEARERVLADNKNLYFGDSMIFFDDPRIEALKITDATIRQFGFGLQKGSEFAGIFDYHLLKMKESGVLDIIRQNYYGKMGQPKKGDLPNHKDKQELNSSDTRCN